MQPEKGKDLNGHMIKQVIERPISIWNGFNITQGNTNWNSVRYHYTPNRTATITWTGQRQRGCGADETLTHASGNVWLPIITL